MTLKDSLRPTKNLRVMDLVKAAGLNVSEWEKSKSGASNPKYCREWAFVQQNRKVVLNLWHDDIGEVGQELFNVLNPRRASNEAKAKQRDVLSRKANLMDKAIAHAYKEQLPVRVIFGVSSQRDSSVAGNLKSVRVEKRCLDDEPWSVQRYDAATGECRLSRGQDPLTLESDAEAQAFAAQERNAGFQPNPEIRRLVELHAMHCAQEKLSGMGFGAFNDTSAHECYDLTCEREGELYYVEVKGTQGAGTSVILTANEADHAMTYPHQSIAVIISHIEIVNGNGTRKASGGDPRVYLPWTLESSSLTPLQYQWNTTKNQ